MATRAPSSVVASVARLRALRHLIGTELDVVRRHQSKADINVTPLVDVVLVLLIIFMVVTPLIANGVAVELPKTVHHAKKADDGTDIMISLTASEQLYLGARPMPTIEALVAAVTAEKRAHPEKSVYLKGDHRSRYGRIREVMEKLHGAGIDDIVLGTEELSGEP